MSEICHKCGHFKMGKYGLGPNLVCICAQQQSRDYLDSLRAQAVSLSEAEKKAIKLHNSPNEARKWRQYEIFESADGYDDSVCQIPLEKLNEPTTDGFVHVIEHAALLEALTELKFLQTSLQESKDGQAELQEQVEALKKAYVGEVSKSLLRAEITKLEAENLRLKDTLSGNICVYCWEKMETGPSYEQLKDKIARLEAENLRQREALRKCELADDRGIVDIDSYGDEHHVRDIAKQALAGGE